jgi:hypothetical protein
MAGANLSTLSTILKEYYLGPVAEQLNNEVLLLSRLEAKSEDLVGKRAYVPLHWGRSSGVGARSESAALPSAGKQQYEKAVYDLKYLYGRVEVTGPSMAKTKNEAGAFLQALKSELDGVRNDLKKDLARQVYGNGTGAIAVGTAGSTTTLTVPVESLRKGQIYPGMIVDIFDVSASTSAATYTGIVVDSVVLSTGVVTFTTTLAAALASGDYIVRAGVTVQTAAEGNTFSLSDEVDGLQRIVASATGSSLGGITATGTATWWDNQRITASGASGSSSTFALTLEDIQKGLNLARIAGGMPTSVVTSLGVQREFYSLLQSVVRYVEPDSNLSYGSGFKALSYNGMPIIADIDAPYGKMYILDESTIKVFSDQDWHFLDADGLTLRQVTGYDKFEAVMARYMNLGANRRNNQVVINSIAVDGAPDTGF